MVGRVLLAFVILGAFFVGSGWMLTRSSLFQFSHIEFEKDLRSDLKERVYLHLAPFLGNHLVTISLSQVQRQLSEHLPHFKNLKLRKRLPSTLIFKAELVEVMALELREDVLWQLGERCEPIEPMTLSLDLPLVEFEADEPHIRSSVCRLLSQIKIHAWQQFGWEQLTLLRWTELAGLDLRVQTYPTVVRLGFENWLSNLVLADKTLTTLVQNDLIPQDIDSSFNVRAVVLLPSDVNRLNLNKLVRRETQSDRQRSVKALPTSPKPSSQKTKP